MLNRNHCSCSNSIIGLGIVLNKLPDTINAKKSLCVMWLCMAVDYSLSNCGLQVKWVYLQRFRKGIRYQFRCNNGIFSSTISKSTELGSTIPIPAAYFIQLRLNLKQATLPRIGQSNMWLNPWKWCCFIQIRLWWCDQTEACASGIGYRNYYGRRHQIRHLNQYQIHKFLEYRNAPHNTTCRCSCAICHS